MTNRVCVTLAFAAGISFVACTQLIGIEDPEELWCGDGVLDRKGGEECDDGDRDGDGHADDTETCNGDCSVPTSTSCYARCCDGTLGKNDNQNGQAHECGFWGGAPCASHEGPVRIRYGGSIIWPIEGEPNLCPTLRACSGQCCDDIMFRTHDDYSEDRCEFVHISACQELGGLRRVTFGDKIVSEGICD